MYIIDCKNGTPMMDTTWSQIELNRAKKPRSFRRANGRKLELPPWAKVWWPGGRIFWPKAGILVRPRSLWVTIPVRNDPPGSPGAPLRGAAGEPTPWPLAQAAPPPRHRPLPPGGGLLPVRPGPVLVFWWRGVARSRGPGPGTRPRVTTPSKVPATTNIDEGFPKAKRS